jgi:hypothetical protein
VCYTQCAHVDKPDEDLPSKKLYNIEELNDLNNMASIMPLPLELGGHRRNYLERLHCVILVNDATYT